RRPVVVTGRTRRRGRRLEARRRGLASYSRIDLLFGCGSHIHGCSPGWMSVPDAQTTPPPSREDYYQPAPALAAGQATARNAPVGALSARPPSVKTLWTKKG